MCSPILCLWNQKYPPRCVQWDAIPAKCVQQHNPMHIRSEANPTEFSNTSKCICMELQLKCERLFMFWDYL